jgi:hypothetical protein
LGLTLFAKRQAPPLLGGDILERYFDGGLQFCSNETGAAPSFSHVLMRNRPSTVTLFSEGQRRWVVATHKTQSIQVDPHRTMWARRAAVAHAASKPHDVSVANSQSLCKYPVELAWL